MSIEQEINITGLERGIITETGSYENATDAVRSGTGNYITGNPAFIRAQLECTGLKDSLDGNFDGDTNIKSMYDLNAYITNANYNLIYYWCFGYRDNELAFSGWIGLRIPVEGGNKSTEAPYISGGSYRMFDRYLLGKDRYYKKIDVGSDTITYYDSGQSGSTITTTLHEFISNGEIRADDSFVIFEKGKRTSREVPCDVAILGYSLNNNIIYYSDRWLNGVSVEYIDLSPYAPIYKYKFVLKVPEKETLVTNELISKKIILKSGSWSLDSNDVLSHSDLPEPINTDIFVEPYPASFWYYDNELERVNMMLIPQAPLTTNGIVHDNPSGNEYFNVINNVYNNALQSAHNAYRLRLEILSDDESTIGEITKDLSLTAAGQITINYEQITRRSCSLSLINVENKYIPTKNSPFWLNRKFKLWLGLVVGKDTYWWSEGVFYTVSANANGRVLNIEAVDKGGALDGTLKLNMTEVQYQFGHNVPITEIIKQSLSLDVGNPYGATSSPIGYGGNRPVDCKPPLVGIEYYGFKTVSDISIDANAYISELFVQMGELYAADCYYNTDGYLMFVPHIDSTGYKYAPTQWAFTDLSNTFEDVNYEYNFEGENVVTVYTNTSESGVRNVAWTAYNTNPLSPINVSTGIRRAEHIEIPYYYNAELDQEEQERQQIKDCRSAANHYLLASSMVGMTLTFNTPIIPHMDVNKTIQITDQYADIEDGIYVVQSLTIPLSGDKMQVTATNINWLPNDMSFSGVSEIIESQTQTDNNNGGGAA